MTCVLCVTDGRLAETKDRYYLYHNAISREFPRRHESGAFVGKSIFSLWTLACQTKVISYASISDQMVLPTDIIHGKSKFYAFYVDMMFGRSRAD